MFLVIPGVLGIALLAWGLYLGFRKAQVRPAASYPQARVTIGGRAVRAAVADTLPARMRGLSERADMAEDEAMLFVFPIAMRYSFWMKDMKFPLDVVWIRAGSIVDISEKVPAPGPSAGLAALRGFASKAAADMALEVNAGLAARHGWQVGAAVQVVYN